MKLSRVTKDHCRLITSRRRNSSIELMRILAMLFIIVHHYILYGYKNMTIQPMSVNKVLLETFAYSGGKIGAVLFFLISA